MAKKKLIIWGLGVSAFHLVITLIAFVIAYADTMDDFDRGERTPPTQIQKVAHVLTPILMQPAVSLWTPWMSKHMPNLVECLVFFANSMLWGFGVVVVFKGLREAVIPITPEFFAGWHKERYKRIGSVGGPNNASAKRHKLLGGGHRSSRRGRWTIHGSVSNATGLPRDSARDSTVAGTEG